MKNSLLLCFSLIVLTCTIYSQNDSVASVDHSKITLSTDIVPQWKVQMEVGGTSRYTEYTRTYLQGTPAEYEISSTHLLLDIPSLAFRVGIIKNVEFRFAAVFKQEHYTSCSNSLLIPNRHDGYYAGGPLEAGIKVKLLDESKMFPSAAVKADIYIPAGNYYFHMDYISPVFRLMLQKNFNSRFGISVNAGYGWSVYDSFTEKYGSYSLSLNANVSKRLGAYAESFSYFQDGRTPDHRIGGGFTFHFARNVMAVVQGGFGISERAPDLFGSGGIGFMFP